MIDIRQVWVPEMLNYCALVADRERLVAAFKQQPDAMWTSVISYPELVCQIFDDLDASELLNELTLSDESTQLKDALGEFVVTFDRFDKKVGDQWQPNFDVPEWEAVENAARSALLAAESRKPN